MPGVSNLVKRTDYNRKINEIERKSTDHNYKKYIATPKFYKWTSKDIAARLKQVNLVTKIEFRNKLTTFNKRITSNKTKHLEVKKKLESLITKEYKFFLDRIYFTSNDGPQNMFVYQPTFNPNLGWG